LAAANPPIIAIIANPLARIATYRNRHPREEARKGGGEKRQALRRRQRLDRGAQRHVCEEHAAYPYDDTEKMQPAGDLHARDGR
jgi:hypothetical protein